MKKEHEVAPDIGMYGRIMRLFDQAAIKQAKLLSRQPLVYTCPKLALRCSCGRLWGARMGHGDSDHAAHIARYGELLVYHTVDGVERRRNIWPWHNQTEEDVRLWLQQR